MDSSIKRAPLPMMLCDATLGRLCKWLRMTGIDAEWDAAVPDPVRLKLRCGDHHRWVLTRSRKVFTALGPERCLLLQADTVHDQIRCVIRHFGIERGDLNPLSRCIRCNREMDVAVSKQSITGQVPDHIWQSHDHFMRCPQCRRIYWRGSHTRRIRSILNGCFA